MNPTLGVFPRKYGVPDFGVLIIRILLVRVLCLGSSIFGNPPIIYDVLKTPERTPRTMCSRLGFGYIETLNSPKPTPSPANLQSRHPQKGPQSVSCRLPH